MGNPAPGRRRLPLIFPRRRRNACGAGFGTWSKGQSELPPSGRRDVSGPVPQSLLMKVGAKLGRSYCAVNSIFGEPLYARTGRKGIGHGLID